jgi:hypothetical protein
VRLEQVRKVFPDNMAPGGTEDIADKQNNHFRRLADSPVEEPTSGFRDVRLGQNTAEF